MKTTAFTVMIALTLLGCTHQEKQEDLLKFIPPEIKADKNYTEKIAEKNIDNYAVVEGVTTTNNIKLPDPVAIKTVKPDTVKKITKDGDISFETGNVVQTRINIIHAVERAGGYIAEDNQSKDEDSGKKEYVLKVRIPSNNFGAVLDRISGTADKIDSKNIAIKDITTDYIDIKSRLDNKKKLEARYLALLDKASKMSDILQIEAKLTEIRSDIESTQGQLNYMNKQVAFSSLDITFYSKFVAAASGDGFGYKFKSAVVGGWDWLQNFFFGLISVWPIVIACVGLSFVLPRYIRKRSTRVAAID